MESSATPLVSVIMNCYNSDSYLREAIDSVIAQTYTNWEIIFWDNCSTDNSAEIVKSYDLPKIYYFYASKHTTLGEARNLALSKINGDYFAFLDADDIWEEKFLARTMDSMNSEQKKYSGVFTNYFIFDIQRSCKHIQISSREFNYTDLLKYYDIGMSACVVSASIQKENNIHFDNSYSMIEDYDFFLKIAHVKPFYYQDEPLMHYRVHDLSLSNTNKKGWGKELNHLYEYIVSTYPELANNKNIKWIKARAVNSDINEAIDEGKRFEVLLMVKKYWKISTKLLFPLIYVVFGKYIYMKIYNQFKKPIHNAF